MASNPVRLHPEAEQEYLTTLAWYQDRNTIAATKFENAFGQAINRIRNSPQRWPTFVKEFRKYTLRQFPFSIVYQNLSSEIVVFAVAHGRRRPGYWRNRV
jgi:plasmid stabilization system protein ParE